MYRRAMKVGGGESAAVVIDFPLRTPEEKSKALIAVRDKIGNKFTTAWLAIATLAITSVSTVISSWTLGHHLPSGDSHSSHLPLQHENRSSLQHASEINSNKSLVILLGELRAGEQAWGSLYKNVLDLNSADLAVLTSRNTTLYPDSSLLKRAKHVWYYDNLDDWADAVDEINGTRWRTTHLPHFHDWNVYSYPGRNRTILFGGIGGHSCDPITARVNYCTHDGSGIIIFMLRYWLMQHIEEDVLDKYETFVITRTDHVYLCRHDFRNLSLRENTIWVPSGEEYGGYSDRHLIAGRDNVLDALDIMRSLILTPYEWDYEIHHNTERFIKHVWHGKNLRVKQFPRVMFTVAAENDSTRWQVAKTKSETFPGLLIKYPREMYGAEKGCMDQHNNSPRVQEQARLYREGKLNISGIR